MLYEEVGRVEDAIRSYRQALKRKRGHHDTRLKLIALLQAAGKLDEAIKANNASCYGLSSALFTQNLQHAERFLSASGSDCGLANINIGTSGADDRRNCRQCARRSPRGKRARAAGAARGSGGALQAPRGAAL